MTIFELLFFIKIFGNGESVLDYLLDSNSLILIDKDGNPLEIS